MKEYDVTLDLVIRVKANDPQHAARIAKILSVGI